MPASEADHAIARLRERCGGYYEELPEPSIRLIVTQRRPQSLLLRYELAQEREARRILVKIPTAASPLGEKASDIPRVAPLPEPRLKPRMEYLALRQIRDHFDPVADPRLGVVRVLDFWADSNATVMEEVPGSSVRSLLSRSTRLHPGGRVPTATFETLGNWLARFQAIPPHELCRPRGATREEFDESVAGMTEFLASKPESGFSFDSAAQVLRKAARHRLPDAVPLGLAHGDFAPRNVLVGRDGKVTVIDTLARFQAPIYEDLGYFLNDLRTARLQTCTLGAAYSDGFLGECRRSLLRGWSEDLDAHRAVPLFEAQALLDRWCARAGGSMNRGEFFLTRLHFSRRLRHLCSELSESA